MSIQLPNVRLTRTSSKNADVVLLGVVSKDGSDRIFGREEFDYVQALLARADITSSLDSVTRIPDPIVDTRTLLLVGMGTTDISSDTLRYCVGAAIRNAGNFSSLEIALPTSSIDEVNSIAEGALLGCYSFDDFRTATQKKNKQVRSISIVCDFGADDSTGRSRAIAEAVGLVKDLVNTPPNELSPDALAKRAVASVAELPIRTKVWNERELQRSGFGGIVGVGQGSSRPPRLVRLTYSPAKWKKHIALVGKGITFDTGGLSLKPPAGMLGMKYDMTGAATVLSVIRAIAQLRIPVAVTAWMCLAENMPSGTAIRPNDVIRMYDGSTVEVTNTDAEGRLVLADGLVAAEKERPDLIVDIATLTGAASVALGTRYAGVMGDSEAVHELVSSAAESGEQFWPMPLPQELKSLLKSDVADIVNAKVGNTAGGMLLGATFLREFVKTTPWAHIDIASCANNAGSGFGFTGPGPTGVGVRALIRQAERLARE
jgi:leucyl aminopeptidase